MEGERIVKDNDVVRVRELYAVKDEILAEIKPLSAVVTQVQINKDDIHENSQDIKDINKRFNVWSGLNSLGVAIGTVLGISITKAP